MSVTFKPVDKLTRESVPRDIPKAPSKPKDRATAFLTDLAENSSPALDHLLSPSKKKRAAIE